MEQVISAIVQAIEKMDKTVDFHSLLITGLIVAVIYLTLKVFKG